MVDMPRGRMMAGHFDLSISLEIAYTFKWEYNHIYVPEYQHISS